MINNRRNTKPLQCRIAAQQKGKPVNQRRKILARRLSLQNKIELDRTIALKQSRLYYPVFIKFNQLWQL